MLFAKVNMMSMVLFSLLAIVSARSDGAPGSACADMTPNHDGEPQGSLPPFTITPDTTSYAPGQTVDLLLEWTGSAEGFKGFLIKVTAPGSLDAVGAVQVVDGSVGHVQCEEEAGNGVTHSSADAKTSVALTWTAPAAPAGDLEVRVSIVQEFEVFWVAEHVADLIDGSTTS